MKKVIFIISIILLLICALRFGIISERKKFDAAKQATEAVAIERLGENYKIVKFGWYFGMPPHKRGFWFGIIDEKEVQAIIYVAVPTLDGKDWMVREHISQYGSDHQRFFATFTD